MHHPEELAWKYVQSPAKEEWSPAPRQGLSVVKQTDGAALLLSSMFDACSNFEGHTDLAALKMAAMMPLSFSSTSSLLQAMRALFCAISSPETATPPALAAFAGPNSILFLWYTAMACAQGSHRQASSATWN